MLRARLGLEDLVGGQAFKSVVPYPCNFKNFGSVHLSEDIFYIREFACVWHLGVLVNEINHALDYCVLVIVLLDCLW